MPGDLSAIRAGKAAVEVSANDEALRRGLLRSERRLRQFAAKVETMSLRASRAAASSIPRSFRNVGSQFADSFIKGIKKAESAIKDFGQRVSDIGKTLLKGAFATGLPLALSARVFAGFESQMARVQALTSATGEEFSLLENQAKQLGRTTVFTASQAAEAMGVFALAGFNVGQIMEAVTPTLNLAAAGQLSMADAAQIAVRLMAGMGIAADDVGEAIDVMTKAMTTANTDLYQLGEAFSYVGPTARTAGLSLEEITAAIQILSNAGIQSEKAGTTLRTGLLSLTSPSKEAADELDRLGVVIADAAGNTRPLAAIIGDLERGLASAGTAERLGSLGRIFNARQAQGFAALINAGSQQLRDFTERLRDSGGEAERIAKIQLNTLSGQLIILKSAVQDLAIEVADSFQGGLRVAAKEVTRIVTKISSWIKANKAVVVGVASISTLLGVAGATLLSLGLAIKVSAFALGGLATVFSVLKAAIVGIVAVLSLPTPLLIGIGAALASLGTLAITSKKRIGEAVSSISTGFKSVLNIVEGSIAGIGDAIKTGDLERATEILWAGLETVWARGVLAITEVWETGMLAIKIAGIRIWDGITGAWQSFRQYMETSFPNFTAFIVKTWASAVLVMRKLWAVWQDYLAKGLAKFLGFFGDDTSGVTLEESLKKSGLKPSQQKALLESLRSGELGNLEDRFKEIEDEFEKDYVEATRKQIRTPEEVAAEHALENVQAETKKRDALAAAVRQRGENVKEIADQLQKSQERLNELLLEARQKRLAADSAKGKAGVTGGPGELGDDLPGALEAAIKKVSSVGTFNPFAVRGFAGDTESGIAKLVTISQEQKREAIKNREQLKKIEDVIRRSDRFRQNAGFE